MTRLHKNKEVKANYFNKIASFLSSTEDNDLLVK